MIPKEPMAQRSNAPPVNKLYIPRTEAPWEACALKNSARTFPFKPGMRMIASSRQMPSNMKVKRIRDLSSGILKQLLNVLAMAASMLGMAEGENPKAEIQSNTRRRRSDALRA
jgi:hypothetical protein